MSSHREIENLIYAASRLGDNTRYEEMYDLMDGCTFIVSRDLSPEGYKDNDWNEVPCDVMRKGINDNMPKLWGQDQKQLCFHSITNVEIYVDEEAGTAHSICRLNVFQGVPEISFPIQSIGFGTYEDTFRRIDGKWRYATHKIDIEVFGDVSQHFLS